MFNITIRISPGAHLSFIIPFSPTFILNNVPLLVIEIQNGPSSNSTDLSGGALVVARQLLVVGGPEVVADLVGGDQVRLRGQDGAAPVLQRGQARVEVAPLEKKILRLLLSILKMY